MKNPNNKKSIAQQLKLFVSIAFISISTLAFAQPANDNPCNATVLPANVGCTPVAGTNAGANSSAGGAIPAPTCAAYTTGTSPDVWYQTVVPASGSLSFTTFAGSLSDGAMAAYTGTCGAMTEIACNDDYNALMPYIALTGQTPGATIWICMFGFASQSGTYTICAQATVPPPPCTNNTCATPNCIQTNPTLTMCSGVPSIGSGGVYSCMGSTPNAIWNVFQATISGPITLGANSSGGLGGNPDIDYCLWGPFGSPAAGCAGISAATVVPAIAGGTGGLCCDYTTNGLNSCTFNAVAGQTYVLITTNYSNQTGVIVNFPVSPAGSITCTGACAATAGSNSPICAGTALNLTCAVVAGATLYHWTGPNGFNANGQNQTIAGATVLAAGVYTVTVTTPGATCTGTTTVTVNPLPSVTNAPAPLTICSGGIAAFTPVIAPAAGATYSWTASVLPAGSVTGFAAAGAGPINNVLTNSGAVAGTVTYVITPIGAGPTLCHGPTVNYVVTVNPSPTITNPPAQVFICSGSTATYNPTANIAGGTFNWTATPNPNNGTITGFPAAGSGNINTVINNTGTTPGSVLFVVTPIGPPPSNCPGNPVNFIANVYPQPSIANAGPNQNLCSTTLTATLAGNVPTVGVGTWTTISGGGVIANISLANSTVTGLSPGANVFEWVITNAPCVASTSQVTITVDPAPTISNNPLTQDICSGATASLVPTSSVAGATFAYTATTSLPGTITGFTPAGVGNISDVVTNSGTTSGTITYVVTPTGPPPTNCPGTPSNFVVTVEPTPLVTNAVLTQSICSGVAAVFNPTSNVAGTVFNWTATASAGTITGFTAAGTGNINNVITNTGVAAGTVTYVITPTGPGATACAGPPVNFVVTVDPAPIVTNNPLTQNFCSGGTATLNLTSNVAGATFAWTATTTLPGTITGFTAAGGGNTISDIITNTGATSGTVTYVITASSPGLGCPGVPVNFIATIDPIPTVTNAVLTQEFCAGGTATFTPTSNVTGATYTWTATASSGNITGFTAAGAGNISDVINNSGGTSETVTYVITPIGPGISACGGPPVNFVVTVDPIPVVTNAVLTQNFCSGGNATFTPTSNTVGTTFAYTATGSSGNITGYTAAGAGNINDILTNSGSTSETVTYAVTPTGPGPNFCPGLAVNFVVTVDPTPVINNAVLNQTICSGNTATITPTSNVINSTFAYTAVGSSGNVTGFTAAGAGNINDVLVNSGNVTETVTYSVTPTGPAATNCPGLAVNFVVTVDPTPIITNNPLTQAFCSGGNATLAITSNVANATFVWTATGSSGNVTGFTANGSGNNINDVLTNSGTSVETVTYAITPTEPGVAACAGAVANFVVTIDPIPTITNSPLTQAFCSGGTATLNLLSTVAGTTFTYTATSANGTAIGFTAAGAGNINDVITNPGPNSDVVTYVITPTEPGVSACTGPNVNYVVTVDPIPDVSNAVLTQAFCSGGNATFTPTSTVNGVTFNWTATASAGTITGFTASGSGPINDIISNTGAASGTVTYVITPVGTGTSTCTGNPVNFVVTVDPTPTVTNNPLTQVFCSGNAVAFVPTSNVIGTTFTWTSTTSSGNVTGNTAIGGGNITDVLTNTGGAVETVSYAVTPVGPGLACPVTNVNFVVTVNPAPTITNATLTQSICTGGTASFVPTANLAGTTFAWTATASAGITGFTASGTGNISDVLTNTGASGTVTYVITPTSPPPASCTGGNVSFVVTVNPNPVPLAGSNTPVCAGSPLNLTANTFAGGTYSWTGPMGYISAAQNPTVSATATAGMAGTYNLLVTVLGCPGNASTTVVINPLPTATVTGGGAVCFGNPTPSVSIALTGTGPWNITYTDGTTPTTVVAATSPYVINTPTAGTYTVTTVSDIHCTGTSSGSAAVVINPLPVAGFKPDVTIGCAPFLVTYTDTSTVASGNITGWLWDFGDGSTSIAQAPPAHSYALPGSYSVTLTVTSAAGCTSTVQNNHLITVVPPPVAAFTCPPSANYYLPIIPFTDHSTNATSWHWDFGDAFNLATDTSALQNPTHSYSQSGGYCVLLTVSNQGLCVDTATVCVQIIPEYTCFIPNAFSPNHDGINDEFFCKATNVLTFEMYIYDRWGNSIFYSNDLLKYWDGTVNGGAQATEDVYVYVIKIKDIFKEDHQYIGNITLVK